MDFPGEKLLLRLWETVAEKGIGSLLSPWQIRREGRARLDVRRDEVVALAQAERDAADIRAGVKQLDAVARVVTPAHPLALPPGDNRRAATPVAEIAARNALADAVRREINVAKAILAAEAEVENDRQEPPNRKVDDDWLFRWREHASSVGAEDLQNLWGRVLAGEIKSPGSFSLRALDFLKNLSQQEAVDIAKLSRFAIDEFIFRGDEALLRAEGITYGFLLTMQELGVIAGVEALGLTIRMKSLAPETFIRGLVSHDRVLVVTHEDAMKELQLHVCQLTAVGRQILRLGTFQAHEGYLRSAGSAIRSQGFRVQLAHFQPVTETEGRYVNAQDL